MGLPNVAGLLQHLAQSALTINHLTQQDLCWYTLKRGPQPERKTAWDHIYSKENYKVKQLWPWTSNWISIENRQMKPKPKSQHLLGRGQSHWQQISGQMEKMQGGHSHPTLESIFEQRQIWHHDKVSNINDDNWTASTGKDHKMSLKGQEKVSNGPWKTREVYNYGLRQLGLPWFTCSKKNSHTKQLSLI